MYDIRPEFRLAAYHQAGHAVAHLLTAQPFTAVSLRDNCAGGSCSRRTPTAAATASITALIAYAGPWAEARADWPSDTNVLDEDEDGISLDDYVFGRNIMGLHQADFATFRSTPGEDLIRFVSILEPLWYRIDAVARALMLMETHHAPEVRDIRQD